MKERKIRVSYEANRLSELYLSDAYEKITRVIKQKINFGTREKNQIEEDELLKLRRTLK